MKNNLGSKVLDIQVFQDGDGYTAIEEMGESAFGITVEESTEKLLESIYG